MISFDECRVVDLSPRIKARVHRVDGTIEEGTRDPYGKPWVMQEGRFPGIIRSSRSIRRLRMMQSGIRNV